MRYYNQGIIIDSTKDCREVSVQFPGDFNQMVSDTILSITVKLILLNASYLMSW